MKPVNSGANQENIPIPPPPSSLLLWPLMQAEVLDCVLMEEVHSSYSEPAMFAMQLDLGANVYRSRLNLKVLLRACESSNKL